MVQDLIDDRALSDGGNDAGPASAFFTVQNVKGEGFLEKIRPAHGRARRWFAAWERLAEDPLHCEGHDAVVEVQTLLRDGRPQDGAKQAQASSVVVRANAGLGVQVVPSHVARVAGQRQGRPQAAGLSSLPC